MPCQVPSYFERHFFAYAVVLVACVFRPRFRCRRGGLVRILAHRVFSGSYEKEVGLRIVRPRRRLLKTCKFHGTLLGLACAELLLCGHVQAGFRMRCDAGVPCPAQTDFWLRHELGHGNVPEESRGPNSCACHGFADDGARRRCDPGYVDGHQISSWRDGDIRWRSDKCCYCLLLTVNRYSCRSSIHNDDNSGPGYAS
jgi:hypothetical protein